MVIMPTILIAQGFDDQTIDVPFDGGVSLLVAAGIGYGLKKVYDKRKEEKDSESIEK
jgi:hypothetical protein